MNIKKFPAGEVIFRKGDAPDFAYFIDSGEVELFTEDGGEVWVLHTLGENDLFGEVAVIEDEPRQWSARAKSNVVLQTHSADDFAELYDQSPVMTQKLIFGLFNNTKAASEQVAALTKEIERKAKEVPVPLPPSPAAEAKEEKSGDTPLEEEEQEGIELSEPEMAFFSTLDRVTDRLARRVDMLEQQLSGGLIPGDHPRPGEGATGEDDEAQIIEKKLSELEDFGIIQPLILDDTINDILINGSDGVYIERAGKLERTDIRFPDDEAVMLIAHKIMRALGRTIDKRRPLVDARLLDGSRVNIIAPPLAVDGTSISIRKFSKKSITLDIMSEQANISEQLAEFLKVVGRCRINCIISGGTGSGKTTLLNAISRYISEEERIVTIEDAAELQLQQPHVVRMETKPLSVGVSPEEVVTMRDLVKNALRMRPDRIIVGEVRGDEAFDMLQAMNTGHEGSLTTVHANHPRDALSRLENMIGMANLHIPVKSMRMQISSAINLIVQVSRMRDGRRRITHVTEIVGMENDMITTQDLFQFAQEGEDETGNLHGVFRWSGIMPRFLRRAIYYGEGERLSNALGVKLPKV